MLAWLCVVALALEPSVPPAERLASAELAVVATVADQESAWLATEIGGMETTAWLTVEEVLQGAAPTALTLALPGGQIGRTRVEVSGVPTLHVDRRYLLLLVKRDDGRYAVACEQSCAVRLDSPSVAPGPSLDGVLQSWGVAR